MTEENNSSDTKIEETNSKNTVIATNNTEKTATKKSFLIGQKLVLSLIIILIVGLAFGLYGFNSLNSTGKIVLSGNKNPVGSNGIPIELFVMSQCPYGTQAEDTVIPVIESFGSKVDFKLYFIASENENGFVSLHGLPEVNEDIRQVCIQEKVSQEKFFDYLTCVNKDIGNVESKWKTCAEQSGINVSEITFCSTGKEGKALFSTNIKKAEELAVGGSPTYYINSEKYAGARDAQSLTRNLCSLTEAEVCSTLPEETEVNFFMVNDFDCKECEADVIADQLKGWFPKMKLTKIDFTSAEGKAVLEKFQAETVPFFYFDSTIEEHYNWTNFKPYTEEADGLHALNFTGTKFFNRTLKENHIDLFVMSQCPYGTAAENNLKEVVEAISGMTFNLYFIANETDSGFDSLHGQVEVNEDIRQTCIIKYDRTKLLDYTTCMNQDIANAEGNWKACAIKSEIDVKTIESCSIGEEGKQLFKTNIQEGNVLGVGSSPTFIVNGQILFRAGSAQAIKEVLCSYNTGLDGCDKTLSGTSSTNTVSGSC